MAAAVFALDVPLQADRIGRWMRDAVGQQMRRRGCVVALSGGVDSSLCAALAARALGPDKVFGLLLPERESSPDSARRARLLVQALGIAHAEVDITEALQALGCYAQRDAAVQRVFPGYEAGWGCRIGIGGGHTGGINFFRLDVQSPDGQRFSQRLPHREYLQIVAATNFKQRVRKTLEYFHADRLNYAVVGTPNRLEIDQGFFVKQGDGTADLKPIAHLYKTQVFQMARELGVPAEICEAQPTTDTYTLPQGQDEFYFALSHVQMDLALWALEHQRPAAELAAALDIPHEQARRVYADIRAKRAAAAHLLANGLTVPDTF
ncbi:MAG: NAD(+) synthase [Rubrivivax sp.]|nr:NAD(+) synthase [Rubrivivax sp.]